MHHSSHFMKREDHCVMPQIPSSSSSTGKHRGMKRDTMRTSPGRHSTYTSDTDSKNRTHARRRIQLACVRCRKRKIKCSGETPDGAACTNCKAANVLDCQFLRPDTTQLLPTPGSALAFHYQAMASSDSIGGRIHQHTVSPTLSPSTYDASYPRSHSLSDLGNYGRVDSMQREPVYGNGLMDEIYTTPYNLHSYPPGSMGEYYGSVGGGRTWNSVPAAAMMAELERQNTIFYATDVPSFFPAGNMLSSEDLSGNRLLPVPTSSGPSSTNGSNTQSFFRDVDVTTTGLTFLTGEETGNVYSSGMKSLNSPRAKSVSTAPLSSAYDTSGILSRDEKSENPNQNLMRYTAITDSALTTIPITSPAFARSGTDSSDIEEPLMMSINGLKNVLDDGHNKNDKSSAYGYGSRDRSDSVSYSHTGAFLQSSSNVRGLPLSHQGY